MILSYTLHVAAKQNTQTPFSSCKALPVETGMVTDGYVAREATYVKMNLKVNNRKRNLG